jgi:hypothetical protein
MLQLWTEIEADFSGAKAFSCLQRKKFWEGATKKVASQITKEQPLFPRATYGMPV